MRRNSRESMLYFPREFNPLTAAMCPAQAYPIGAVVEVETVCRVEGDRSDVDVDVVLVFLQPRSVFGVHRHCFIYM